MEEGRQVVESKLPIVFSIVKDYGEPRYPSFMGIRKASKAEIPSWTAGDLGIDPPAAVVSWPEVMAPPAKEITNEIIGGDSPDDIAGKLADKIMEEKVL
jgi:electron transfer flavoprotein beta subunit